MSTLRPRGPIDGARAIRLFESLAESAWGWLGHARRLQLGFSEDTISDLTALEVARRASGEVGIGRVSKRKERFVGFDWLWVISRPSGRHAIYAVQAKKMRIDHSKGYSYGRLRYPSTPPYQIEALQDFAQHIDAIPLYCFYNNVDGTMTNRIWNCRREALNAPQMGCTLVPLSVAQRIHDRQIPNRFHSIHSRPEAVPWRCLFHPECSSFSLDRVSERQVESNAQERERGTEIAEFLTESVSEDNAPLDFDDFVNRFDLEETVNRYIRGALHPIMERTLSFRLED